MVKYVMPAGSLDNLTSCIKRACPQPDWDLLNETQGVTLKAWKRLLVGKKCYLQ